jgi:putative ABC transport system permease protein
MMTKILGTTPDFLEIRNFSIKTGEYFTEEENKLSRRVALVGSQVVDVLFENADPLGEIIRIGKVSFEIIGVLNSKGVSAEGANEDNQIIIPINTALRRLFNMNYLKTITVQAKNAELINQAENEIRDLLRERHRLEKKQKEDDFEIQNQIRVIETQQETSGSFTSLIVGIAAISLIVGGIGILAVMLITVNERTDEIGLRMAIGARPKDILIQFLSEALILGFIGGATGILTGILISYAVRLFSSLPTTIYLPSVYLALIFSLVVGLFFGVHPARKASLLDPIEALQAE